MNTINFLEQKKEEIYKEKDNGNFNKKLNNDRINNYHNLSREEKDLFFLNNVRLIAFEIRKMIVENETMYEELMSTGIIGLHKAIQNFECSKGYAFATFASRCIRNEILMYLRKENKHRHTTSLNCILIENERYNLTVEDIIADESINTVDEVYNKIIYEQILRILPTLNETDYFIFTRYYGIEGNKEMVLSDIGKVIGHSQPNVSKHKRKILEKIRNKIKD